MSKRSWPRAEWFVLVLSLSLLLGGSWLRALAQGEGSEPPTVSGASGPELPTTDGGSAPVPVYQTRLEATYDPETFLLQGREVLRWQNTTSAPVEDLCFHHYLNAFANNRTTFFEESGGQLRGDSFDPKKDRWGWIEVSSLRLAGGPDLAPGERYTAPDDGNPFDRTVATYPLPEPLPPGAWVEVEVEFESRFPSIFARTGAHGEYVLAGQWYPKIGVFQDAGEGGRSQAGWNCHQYHANSEFFADFGDYQLTLHLPERYRGRIGATGEMVEETVSDGQVTAVFEQRGVHDVAWTADPGYLVLHDRFDPATDVPAAQLQAMAQLLGRSEEELALSPVDITLFLQPHNAAQAGRYFRAAKAAIRGYGLRLGAYPYSTLTLVDPAFGADGSAGMEYPTFITLGTSPLFELPPFRHILLPEVVTVHEFGHQFWQGMSASNEFEEAWLDEGINSYYEGVVLSEEYGYTVGILGGRIPSLELNRASSLPSEPAYADPLVRPAWGYLNGGSYALNSYPRSATTLDHLERLLGPETFHRAMRHFFSQRAQWHHATTADFEQALEEASGQDLGHFFRQALHSTRKLDYAVRSVSSRSVDEERGIFWEGGERVERDPDEEDDVAEADAAEDGAAEDSSEQSAAADDAAPSDEVATQVADETSDEDDEEDEGPFRSRVVVERRGEFIHPVTVEMRFEDGLVLRRSWNGERRWKRWSFVTESRLVSAEVDPDHLLMLDADRLNNSRRVEPERLPARRLLADILFWLQTLFAATSLLA